MDFLFQVEQRLCPATISNHASSLLYLLKYLYCKDSPRFDGVPIIGQLRRTVTILHKQGEVNRPKTREELQALNCWLDWWVGNGNSNRAIYPVGRFWGPVLRSQQPFPQMTLKGLSIFDRSVFQLTSLAWETQKQGHFRTDALKFSFLNRVVDRWNSPPVTSRTIEQ